MAHSSERSPAIPDTAAGIIDAATETPDGTTAWSTQLTADEAPLVRAALVRAYGLDRLGVSARDAYLQGIADAIGYRNLQDLLATIPDGIDTPP